MFWRNSFKDNLFCSHFDIKQLVFVLIYVKYTKVKYIAD